MLARSSAGVGAFCCSVAIWLFAGCGTEFSSREGEPARSGSGSGGTSSGGSGGTGCAAAGRGGSGTAPAGCAEFVRATCEWQARCTSVPGGSVDACVALNDNACAWYELDGSRVDAGKFGECARGYAANDCTATSICDWPAGGITNGLPCASYIQCQSGYCTATSTACGVCAPNPRREAGEACSTSANCNLGLDCLDRVCTAQAAEGEACGGERTCSNARRESGHLACVDGSCQAVGFVGDPCYMVSGASICGAGATCEGGVCIPYLAVDPGEPCGTFEDREVVCTGGTCTTPEGAREPECVAWAAAGESCHKIPLFDRCADGLTCNESDLCVWPETPLPPVCDD